MNKFLFTANKAQILFVCDGFNTPLLAVTFDSSQTLKIPRSLLRLGFLFTKIKRFKKILFICLDNNEKRSYS